MKKKYIPMIILSVLAFQLLLFAHQSATRLLVSKAESPDTIIQINKDTITSILSDNGFFDTASVVRHNAYHSEEIDRAVREYHPKRYECFRFNPNTVTLQEMLRLGIPEWTAKGIVTSRNKGKKFKKLVQFQERLPDSVYLRLKNYMYLPMIDINKADTLELQYLPEIGSGRAARIVQYRSRFRGFSYKEQIMHVPGILDIYDAIQDRIVCSPVSPLPLWSMSEDSLYLHPYIRYAAPKIIKFKKRHAKDKWTIQNLERDGILNEDNSYKLRKCNIQNP